MAEGDTENNVIAAGGVFGALLAAGLKPVIVWRDGLATNSMTVVLPFMKSRYLITVERAPDQAGCPLCRDGDTDIRELHDCG